MLRDWCFSPSWGRLVVAAGLSLLLTGSSSAQTDTGDGVVNVFRPAPRELRQLLTRAQKALEEDDYAAVVAALTELLAAPDVDDYFVTSVGGEVGAVQVSLKTQALELLGGLPPKARQLLETQVGFEARDQFQKALAGRDLNLLSEVARRYFHTKAGYEATFLLGRLQLDQGRPLAAALLLQRLASADAARNLLDPELSILLAASWRFAGDEGKAVDTLIALKVRAPQSKVRLAGEERPLFGGEGPLPWLDKIVGESNLGPKTAASQWLVFRGDEARNGVSAGSMPLVNFRWSAPLINNPLDEERVRAEEKRLGDQGQPLIPAVQPLIVRTLEKGAPRNYVVVHSPENLLGIDLRTGLRIWVDWWNEIPAGETAPPPGVGSSASRSTSTRNSQLKQRVWDDCLYGQTASDGEFLYFVDGLDFVNSSVNIAAARGVWIGGRMVSTPAPTNQLCAVDLRRQGSLRWTVGGKGGGDEAGLAGAYFLGPPLPVAGFLYGMAEFNGELRLVCLDPKTGKLQWKQQIAALEDSQPLRGDYLRRLASATPSFADGLIICPTAAGAVVAVDPAQRTLRWGYQYKKLSSVARSPFGRPVITSSSRGSLTATRWIDSSVTIARGAVLVTPVEVSEMHCVDLLTGNARWSAPRDDYFYLACVHGENVVLVGQTHVQALLLASGKPAWPKPIEIAPEAPTGRGYYSGKFYYLPTTGKQLLQIDLEKGEIVGKASLEIQLGNLACFGEDLISVGPDHIAAFYLTEPLGKRVTELLGKNPDDAWALARKGEILLQQGLPAEALDSLRRAAKLTPEDASVRSMLARVMLLLLREDYAAYRELDAEAEALVGTPQQRQELLRIRARGLQASGSPVAAFAAYAGLAEEIVKNRPATWGDQATFESLDRQTRVRTDRWLEARLAETYSSADAAQQAQMSAVVAEQAERALALQRNVSLKAFAGLYGFHPESRRIRAALVPGLLKAGELLAAEVLAAELMAEHDFDSQLIGQAALAAIYARAGRSELAERQRERFVRLAALEPPAANHPAHEILKLAEAPLPPPGAEGGAAAASGPTRWPLGKVVKTEGEGTASRLRAYLNNFPVQLADANGAEIPGLRATYDPSNQTVHMLDELGRTISQVFIRKSDGVTRRYYQVPYQGLTGHTCGHLLVVHTGGEVMALGGLGTAGDNDTPLWRTEVLNLDPAVANTVYPQARSVSNPLTGSRMTAYDPTGQSNYVTGPATSRGLTFIRQRTLVCVDILTGETLWERSGVDATAELAGDSEVVLVTMPNATESHVYRMSDGADLGTCETPRPDRRLASAGCRMLSWEQAGSKYKLTLTEVWPKNREVWSLETAIGSKAEIQPSGELAVLDPAGMFRLISLPQGKELFRTQLEPEPALVSLTVQATPERLLVLANASVMEPIPQLMTQPLSGGGLPGKPFHGRVYSLSRTTGVPLWPAPAFIAQNALPSEQPVGSPLLIFLRNRRENDSPNRWTAEILCLDKRDGSLVHESAVATTQAATCEVIADPQAKAVNVGLWLQAGTTRQITLKMSEAPVPPRPPAQTGLLASSHPGVVGKVVNLARELFLPGLPVQNGPPPQIAPQPAPLRRVAPQAPAPAER